MPLPRHLQTSFSSGELSPGLYGRTDLAKYHNGCATLENYIVKPEGSAANRPGFEFQCQPLGGKRMLPFEYSVDDSYVLVLGEGLELPSSTASTTAENGNTATAVLQVIKDGSPVADPDFPSSVWKLDDYTADWQTFSGTYSVDTATAGGVGSVSWPANIKPQGVAEDVGGGGENELTEVATEAALVPGTWWWGVHTGANTTHRVIVICPTDQTASGDPNSTTFGYYRADFGYRLVTPWAWADVADLSYTQVGNIMFFAHPSYPPYKLTRTADDAWAFTALSFTPTISAPSDVVGTYLTGIPSTSHIYQYKASKVSKTTKEESAASAAVSVTGSNPWESDEHISVVWNAVVFSGTYTWTVISGNVYSLDQLPSTEPDELYETLANDVLVEKVANIAAIVSAGQWAWDDAGGGNTICVWITAGGDPDARADGWVRTHDTEFTYYLYKNSRGYFGYAGSCETPWYFDDNVDPDTSDTPNVPQDPFDSPDNYPAVVGVHQQRLLFAATNNQPDTIWMTQTGLFENLGVSNPLKASDSIEATIASRQVNLIRHILPLGGLLIFTKGAEWLMTGADDKKVITPLSINLSEQGGEGCSELDPMVVGNSILFAQRGSSSIREIAYTFQSDKFDSTDMSVLSSHLFKGYEITEWAYQGAPDNVVWALRDDNTILSFTFIKAQEVWAWARHTIPAPVSTEEQNLLSIVSLPSDSGSDDVSVLAKRDSLGTKVWNLSNGTSFNLQLWTLGAREPGAVLPLIQNAVFLDAFVREEGASTAVEAGGIETVSATTIKVYSSVSVSVSDSIMINGTTGIANVNGVMGTVASTGLGYFNLEGYTNVSGTGTGGYVYVPITTLSGLDHMEGDSVTVTTDATVTENVAVAGGTVTLVGPAAVAAAGYPYNSDLETLDLELSQNTIKDRRKLSARATLFLRDTRGGQAGSEEGALSDIRYREADYDDVDLTLTGSVDTVIKGRWGINGRVFVRQNKPWPMTIGSILQEFNADDT